MMPNIKTIVICRKPSRSPSFVIGAVLAFIGLTLPAITIGAEKEVWDARYKVSSGFVYDEFSASPVTDQQSETEQGIVNQQEILFRIQGQGRYRFDDQYSIFVKGSGFYSSDEIVQDSDEAGRPARRYLELRQLYGSVEDLWAQGLRLDVGRKRLKEASGMWFDQNVTVLQMSLARTRFSVSAAIAEEFRAARTDKTDYVVEDEDQRYILLTTDLQWRFQQHLGLDYITLTDRSGALNSDETAYGRGVDREDPDVSWLNWRLSGKSVTRVGWQLSYDTHFSRQSGHLDRYTGSSPAQRLAVDGRLRVVTLSANTVDHQFSKTVGVQWVKTSAGNTIGEEGRFFQTGLQSNRIQLREQRLSLYRFNDAYRPTLQNLEVIGIFLGVQTHHRSSFGVAINSFSRPDAEQSIGDSRYNEPLAPGNKHLGAGADVVWRYEPDWGGELFDEHQIRLRVSQFNAGSAYGDVDFDSKLTARLVWEGTL